MKLLTAAALSLFAVADAATRVAVIEVGAGSTVHRTDAKSADTSADAVVSLWAALHSPGRKPQHAGMTVVPDLFAKPSDGIVIGVSNVDLDSMPTVSDLMTTEGASGVVGHMEVDGNAQSDMFSALDEVETVQPAQLAATAKHHCKHAGISGIQMEATTQNAESVDRSVADMLAELQRVAAQDQQTIVVHLVIEEDEGSARRRHLARRLNEDEEDNNNNNSNEDADNQDGQDGQDGADDDKDIYGYYSDGEWVTPYKSMFQIQYFNVVLWTSVGLAVILMFTISMMVNMPLMEDTLLFGQSAKMSMDD